MDDLISRQAAIENYQRVCATTACADCPFHIVDGAFTDCRLERFIHELPPAQSEIIRCKDCNWWTKQSDSLQGKCALFGMHPTGAWYCGNARKREEKTDAEIH